MISAMQIIFLIVGASTLASAVMVVTTRKIMHAALWLVLALGGVAVMFALLEAGFFAAIQVAVYIGAIAILVIFAVMLTRRLMEDTGPQVNKNWIVALFVSGGLLTGLVYLLSQWQGFLSPSQPLPVGGENLAQFGEALVSPGGFLVPFEVASVLLVAALIGAIFVAGEPKEK
jgi:NADH-quinone oxidoreductase subunit J